MALLMLMTVCSIISQCQSVSSGNDMFSFDAPLKPNISEDFRAYIFANLSTGDINVLNTFTLVRKFSEGKERSVGCQIWKGRPQKTCTYSLLLEPLKVEYEGEVENGTIETCTKSEVSGNELIKLWDWVSNATYYKRDDGMDLWRVISQDGDTYLENLLGVSASDPNKPMVLKQTYRSDENSDDYEFQYKDFDTDVNEEAFDVPAICQNNV